MSKLRTNLWVKYVKTGQRSFAKDSESGIFVVNVKGIIITSTPVAFFINI
jgi:hypothetical protein